MACFYGREDAHRDNYRFSNFRVEFNSSDTKCSPEPIVFPIQVNNLANSYIKVRPNLFWLQHNCNSWSLQCLLAREADVSGKETYGHAVAQTAKKGELPIRKVRKAKFA